MKHIPYHFMVVVLLFSVVLAFPSCTDSSDRDNIPAAPDTSGSPEDTSDILINQKYLFEVYYINFAWGYQHHGIVIDHDGNVFRYAYDRDDEPWQPREYCQVTEKELAQKYDHNLELIATVERPDLVAKYKLISAAAAGRLSEKKHTACDAGSVAFNTFTYDPVSKRYTVVRLRLYGDYEQKNLSTEAALLYDWLATFWPPDW